MQQNNSLGNVQSYRQNLKYARKWTKKEDEKLRVAVQKYGTQWTFIGKRFRFNRSINSLVKRWHGKLKEDAPNKTPEINSQSQNQHESQQVVNRSKRVRKEEKKQQKKQQIILEKKPQKTEPIKSQRRDRRATSRSRSRRYRSRIEKKPKQENIKIQQSKPDQPKADNIQEQGGDSLTDPENDKYIFMHNWKQAEDYILRESIVTQKILNWENLASKLKINDIKQIKKRWQKKIYPSIVDSRKIGGCLKYSEQEDSILSRGVKLGLGINELRRFLPGRTPYSLDARRRRSLRMQEKETPQLRFWTKRLSLYKFVQKRHEHLQKPSEEEFFLYKSDSQ